MKRLILIIVVLLSISVVHAQSTAFFEDFEGTTLSMTSSSTGTNAWGLNTLLYYQGAKSDSCVVTAGDTTYLTTDAFSTLGNSYVMLHFAQICKIAFADKGIIEVSVDGGATWTQLTSAQYLGSGQFATNTNSFNDVSYATDWSPFVNTIPDNSWWKNEMFDISSIAGNKTSVKVRFSLIDGGTAGSEGRYGWLLDNVEVLKSTSELVPPTITYSAPILVDSVYSKGPFTIKATISDASGIDTAMLIYSKNGGTEDTIGMTHAGSLYLATIDTVPAFAIGDTVCYRVVATDASASANTTTNPTLGCMKFVIKVSPPPPGCTTPISSFPYIEDFTSATAGTGTPSSPGTLPTGWTRTPSSGSSVYMQLVKTGSTPSGNTGPTHDHTTGTGKYVYGEASYGSTGNIAYSQSPCIDITLLSAPKLEFWYHMYGATVSTFTVQMWYGGAWIDIWSKSGGQGNLWHKASVNLIPYKCVTQFRFVTKKGSSITGDIAFDDVKVFQGPANDAGITALNAPTSPAISGNLPVKVGLMNYGSVNLTSVNIGWSINGVNQTTHSWTGVIPPYTGVDSIQIGTYAFTAGAPTIKAWTSTPNGVADTLNANDTLSTSIIVCDGYLHGTYTVGTPTSDFSDIGAAVTALNNCGIDSAVVFNVAPSTFTGQLTFNPIVGASATNTITFKGQGAATIIQRTTNSANRDVIRFNGAKHIILDSLTINVTGAPYYAAAIRVRSGSDSNIVRNCSISVPVSTSSYINAIVFSNSYTSYGVASTASYWTIENNLISGGYKAIILYGSASILGNGTEIIGNEIIKFRYYGIYSYYQKRLHITDNYFHQNKYSSAYAVYCNRNQDDLRIERNNVHMTGTSSIHGFYLYYTNYSAPAADTCVVANNMLYLGNATSSSYGIYPYQSNRVKIVYNSVNVNSVSTYSRAFYQSSGSGLVVRNNIFANTGSGYAYYVYSPAAIAQSDYNDLYTAGPKFAYWSGDKANLAALQNASNKDTNSISANPLFNATTDLHTGAVALFKAAQPIYGFATDIDGDVRDTLNSCIGADEFFIAANDAGISELISPLATCAGSTENIIVKVKNYGIDTLQSVTINWKIDGVTQTPYSYTGALLYGETDTVTIGTHAFSAGVAHTMDFWTSLPNNALDSISSNDSLSIINFKTGVAAGTYTIGGASADYPSFTAAVADMNDHGICGPVVFKVSAGVYTEQFVINDIMGASSTNTITFKSANNDSTTVIVKYSATSAVDNYVVKLNGTSNIIFKGINFQAVGSTYARVFVLNNRAGNISIENNIIETTHDALIENSNMHLIYATDSVVGYVSIKNNVLTNGVNAIDLLAAIDTISWEIIGNDIEGHFAKGIHLRRAMSPTIVGNTIYQDTAHSAGFYYGMFFENNTGSPIITDNKVRSTMSPRSYGIRMNYCPYSASPRGRIANNFFQMYSNNSTLTTSSGLLIVSAPNLDIYYNNIQMTGSNVQSTALYLYKAATDSIIFKNNNLTNNAGGYAFYTNQTPNANFTNDYNNLYTYTSTKFAKMLNVEYADLAAYKTATGGGANSVSYDPYFVASNDLHVSNNLLNGSATPISWITTDIDGDIRNATTPDIGADEFDPSSIDLSVLSIVSPQSACGLDSNEIVSVLIKNTGGDTIKGNFTVSYKWTSLTNAVVETVTDTIVPGDTLLYSFATPANLDVSTIGNDVVFDLSSWVNISGDIFHMNDTAYSNVNSYYKPNPPVASSVTSNFGTTAGLTATSANLIWWFNSDTASVPVGVGTSFQTPVLYDTTQYWLSAHTANCTSDPTTVFVNVVGHPAVDAGISNIVWPTTSVVSGTTQILKVAVHNYGTSNLTSAKIFWDINGQIDSIPWTGSLALSADDTVNIDTTSFTGGVYNFRAWTSNPNNVTDTVNANDTSATTTFNACLSGVYTIGDTTGGAVYDFPSPVDAKNAMMAAGICGPVTFLIDSGVYEHRLYLPAINGAGPNARITFTSMSGDSTDVKLHWTLSSSAYWTMKITGSYYTFSNLTISAINSSNYGRALEIGNGGHNNEILNCVVEGTVVNSSSNTYAVIYVNGGATQYNTFKNNVMLNGSYSIYLNGTSTNLQFNNIVENNRMMNFYYYGAYFSYQKNIQFNANYLENSSASNYVYGVRFYNADFTTATKNIINLSGGASHYGMYVYYSDGNATNRNLIANNFITLHGNGNSSWYGIYCYNSKYTNFYHNSVNLTGGSTYSRAFYLGSGSNTKIINNIFSNTGGGYAYYVYTASAVNVSNYNDYYATGNILAYWYGNRATLAALRTANGKDAYSLDSDPMFLSATDLHVGSIDLNNKAFPLSDVTDDIDGETRSTTTPDIGADEFTPPANDAGITNVDGPASPVTVGSNSVLLSLRNFGADTLVSANIAWSVNNVAQTTYAWSGSLPTGTTVDSINIGSYNFVGGPNYLKAWSANPNNQTDGNNLNDTITMTLIGCVSPMHGTYTIGGSSADFLSINDAIMQMSVCGIDSHVVFNINPGTYNEQLRISQIPGAADTATVTFQSSTMDSTDVNIVYSANSSKNYVLYLNGADWVRIRNISIEATSSSAGRALVLGNGATHNIIYGNIIKGATGVSTATAAVYSGGGLDGYNTFMHNDLLNGYYGIYMKGGSSTSLENGNVFKYNNISGFRYYGAYFYYSKNLVFDHNTLSNSSSMTYGYGLYLYYSDGAMQISNNTINAHPLSSQYALRIYYCDATSTNRSKVYNNFISITSGTGTSYGVYIYNSKYQDFTNNNILVKGGSSYGRAIYVSSGSGNRLLNNNFVMDGPGYAYYVGIASAIASSNYNNIYSTGAKLAYWNGARNTLAALQTASGKDGNSVSVDPGYMSKFDLHVTSVSLNAKATPLSWVSTDIDGDVRDTLTPDIGADEFTPLQWDAAVIAFNSPKGAYAAQGTPQTVYARIRNFGTDTITSMNVGYRYANGNTVTQSWTGFLLPGDTSSVLFTTGFTTQIGTEVLSAFTMLPLDGDSTNDTLSMNFAGLPLITPTYCDDFDGQNIWATPGNQWQRGIPQGSAINTAHSAPNVWMTRLSTNYTSNANEYLLSPFIDFSTITSGSTLKFWRNNKFASSDGFSVEYSNDGGSTWITLGYIGDTLGTNWYNGQTGGNHMFTGNSSGWTQSTYDLSQFNQSTNAIQFRFHLRTNASGTDEGVAIDDFCIELPPIPNDVGVISIDAPTDSTQIGLNNTVIVTVKNYGTATQTSIPVSYKIGSSTAVNGTMTIANGLAPDSIAQFTFTQQFQSPTNDYTLCAFTSLAGDIYTGNDQTCENIKATAAALDAGVGFIVAPLNTAPIWKPNEVTVRIFNYGTTPLTSVDVQYVINTSAPVVETWTGTALAMGDSVDFTFTQKYNSPVGYYQVCAKTLLANDADASNDQTCKTILAEGFDEHLENGMKLWQNIPNPANGNTVINYEIPSDGQVRFELVDVLGQSVMIVEEKQSAGKHQISVDANNLATGIYYYTVEFNGYRLTKKMMVTR